MKALFRNMRSVLDLLERQQRLAFFLDFDGTLSPVTRLPYEARFPWKMRRALENLTRRPGVHLAIISGRPLTFLREKVHMPDIFYAGNHGFEISGPEVSFRYSKAERFRPYMERLAHSFGPRLKKIPGALLENKGVTLSLHFRNVPPSSRRAFHRLLQKFKSETDDAEVFWRAGKKIWEVIPRVDWNKGEAIRFLLGRMGKSFPIVMGDDKTDEDMFREVSGKGLAVRVGRAHISDADYYVQDSGAVLRFLQTVGNGKQGK